MPQREALRTAAVWGGRLVVLAAVVFLALNVRAHWRSLGGVEITPTTAGLLGGAVVIYGLALMLVAESWHRLVGGLWAGRLSRYATWPSFGVTQIAKYLPGNVFHYVGRHIYLRARGVPDAVALKAATWEALMLCAAAGVCASLIWLSFPFELAGVATGRASLALTAGVVGVGVGLAAILLARTQPRLATHIPAPASLILSALALTAFFLVQGALFALLFVAIGLPPRPEAVAIASASWLVGYLTPGAPGGIGTREAALVWLATPLTGPANALILAVLLRLVTTGGDFVCFAISSLIAQRSDQARPSASA